MRDYRTFFDNIAFPEEYRAQVLPVIARIERECEAEYKALDADRLELSHYEALAARLGENLDLVMLAACIMMGIDSKVRYDARGISDEIYYASQRELTIWSKRCVVDYGHLGVLGYEWLNNFTDPHVFRIGRLEFEHKIFPKGLSYENHGVSLHGGEPVINIHIPEDGPLDHEEVLASYRKAYEFFGLRGDYPFVCSTWLLYPANVEFLPEPSNIRLFMGDFTVIHSTDEKYSRDLWRVFGRRDSYDPASLPRNNRLQANLADYLAMHDGVTGEGYGVFLHNGKEIVRK